MSKQVHNNCLHDFKEDTLTLLINLILFVKCQISLHTAEQAGRDGVLLT